jgi:type I restriction enzyme M protein
MRVLTLEGKTTTIGDYLARLERDLGDIHRSVLIAGKSIEMLELAKEKVDIVGFTRAYVEELRDRVGGRFHVDFWFEEDPLRQEDLEAFFIQCDSGFLRQIYDNLVANAEKHAFAKDDDSSERINIGILFNFEGGKVQVDFSNTGKPFPENLNWANAIRKGTAYGATAGDGTGLWLINELMERHGGYLAFTDKTGPDGAHSDLVSTFELYFPILID